MVVFSLIFAYFSHLTYYPYNVNVLHNLPNQEVSRMKKPLTYAGSGVDYAALDPFKVQALEAGRATAHHLNQHGYQEVAASRGESAYLIEGDDHYLALVEEGLGTKILVADDWYLGYNRAYSCVAQDTVAMIVNDMATTGARPLACAMHLAVGNSDWLKTYRRVSGLIEGWKHGCDLAGCSWGGGETPTLKGVVGEGTAVVSGSAIGLIKPKSLLIRGDLQDGDAIVMLTSSGIHANGLTLARQIADRVGGYDKDLTELDGTTFGDALLKPTAIYVPVVRACQDAGLHIAYAVHITGHGWRKLMRHPSPFAYVITTLPTKIEVFDFIQRHGNVSGREMYGTFNMGAGFALYVRPTDVERVIQVATLTGAPQGITAYNAGHLERSDRRRVVIAPLNITFDDDELQIR